MTAGASHSPQEVLRELLRPLERHYLRPEVEEVAVCGPELAFRRLRQPDRAGRIWQPARDPDLTHAYLSGIAHCVASVYGRPFNGGTVPTLSGTVPGGHRFTCVAGQGVMHGEEVPEGGISMNIRQAPGEREERRLADFGLAPEAPPPSPLRRIVRRRESSYQQLLDAARSGAPVLVSGPTSSGKTSLLNLLLQEADPHDRIVTVEDTRELRVRNENRVHLLLQRDSGDTGGGGGGEEEGLTGRRLVDVLMRMTPDTIIVGEISTRNAALALEVMGTGHSHFWTTIHAGDADEAMETFAKRVLHTLGRADPLKVQDDLARKVCIIQTQRRGAQRMITDIRMPPGGGAGGAPGAPHPAPSPIPSGPLGEAA